MIVITNPGSGGSGGGTGAVYVYRDESGGTWPLRSTVTSSTATRVTWIGSVAPTIGSGYMQAQDLPGAIPGDIWEQLG